MQPSAGINFKFQKAATAPFFQASRYMMRFQTQILCASLLASAVATFTPASTTATDVLAAKGLLNLAIYEVEQALAGKQGTCTLSNVAIRKEW
jgi:tyrosinase